MPARMQVSCRSASRRRRWTGAKREAMLTVAFRRARAPSKPPVIALHSLPPQLNDQAQYLVSVQSVAAPAANAISGSENHDPPEANPAGEALELSKMHKTHVAAWQLVTFRSRKPGRSRPSLRECCYRAQGLFSVPHFPGSCGRSPMIERPENTAPSATTRIQQMMSPSTHASWPSSTLSSATRSPLTDP
jgi:hypothetical protein